MRSSFMMIPMFFSVGALCKPNTVRKLTRRLHFGNLEQRQSHREQNSLTELPQFAVWKSHEDIGC